MSHPQQNDPREKISEEVIAKFRRISPVTFKAEKVMKNDSFRDVLSSGIEMYTGAWTETQASHLLKRTLFGVKTGEINYFSAITMEEAVDEIVTSSSFPAPPINDYEIPGTEITDPDVEVGETWVEAPYGGEIEGYRIQSLKGWMVNNMLSQETTLQEKMTLFWHNLLVTQFFSVFLGKASYQYAKMLHENAFGNFRDIIKKITLDPAMLFFLNGTYNNKEAPDENYSRELQELFCIGKGPNAGFTESDVQEAAKVLTGWVVDFEKAGEVGDLPSFFYPPYHDTNDKQFSSFYDNTVIQGRSGAEGATETDDLLDMIFNNNEVAAYICRRLYNFFVYHEIDEATETNVIQPLATIFRESNYEILPVLKVLFKSEHFYDAANRGAIIKNPADHLIGLFRTLQIDLSEQTIFESFYTGISLNWAMSEVGMELGDPPSVAGWQAYYQEPTFDRFWINTDTITKRAIRQDSLVFPSWGFWVSENLRISADLLAFVGALNNPSNPNDLINECQQLLLGIDLSQEVKDGFKNILLSGQADDFYWTDAWDLYSSDIENEENKMIVQNRLVSFFQPFLQLAEFQLM